METRRPILFVPGIARSQLYHPENGRKIWFSAAGFFAHREMLGISHPLAVKNNEVDLQTLPPLQREYGVMAQEIILIERLCIAFPDRPIYYFSYDFRRSCAENAAALHAQVDFLRAQGAEDVDIICHSMGGLITSACVKKYGSEHIHKIAALSVPFEGSPEIIHIVLTGTIISVPNYVVEPLGLTKEMLSEYPSFADLMPTREYLALHPMQRGGVPLTPWEMEEVLAGLFQENYAKARAFQDSVKTDGHNVLAGMPNTYFGIGIGKSTLHSVSLNEEGVKLITEESSDGTVPYDSLVMDGYLSQISPDASGSPRIRRFLCSHSDILKFREPLNWLIEILA
ncbi:MAG: hypothetical protein Q4Q04_00200 [Methanocorpusculum sp.]|nr:hypothetical protein [Methanocorpusculum sp.]